MHYALINAQFSSADIHRILPQAFPLVTLKASITPTINYLTVCRDVFNFQLKKHEKLESKRRKPPYCSFIQKHIIVITEYYSVYFLILVNVYAEQENCYSSKPIRRISVSWVK